jgi:Right handed beta helix region/Family of unknown function (DUF6519)
VEITDDFREFSLAPGEIRQIDSVDDSSRTITLKSALTADFFPVDGQNLTDPERHTRIKRWDQDPGGPAAIEVPASGTPFILEDGVEVTFTTEPDGGAFRSGDYWIFVARTADASVEELEAAPPRGVHHHYCRLALVTFPDVVVDCRIFWPPSFGEGKGESCDCTICVTAESHRTGKLTIQDAIDEIKEVGGGTICLGPGVFILTQGPVRLDNAFAVRIRGQGAATAIIQLRGAAFIFSKSRWCTLDYLTILSIADATTEPAIRLRDSVGTTIERLMISALRESTGPLAGVLLEAGSLLQTKIRDNFFRAQFGVFAPKDALFLDSFYCENNSMQCSNTGVQLAGSSYYWDTIIARNRIDSTTVAGIAVTGFASTELDVTGNTITPVKGDGIVLGTGNARISDNEVVNERETEHGIRLVPGLMQLRLATVIVSANRLQGLRGDGISIETLIRTGRIEHNILTDISRNGLVMAKGSGAESLSVLGNQLIDVATAAAAESQNPYWEIAGIYLLGVAVGAVSDNILSGIGAKANDAGIIAGVLVDFCPDMRINDNLIVNLAPVINFKNLAAGVYVLGPPANVQIAGNTIRRQLEAPDVLDDSKWQAIFISSQRTLERRFAGFTDLSATQRVNVIDSLAAASARNADDAGIHGNTLHGYGSAPLVEVSATSTCRFSDNQCSVEQQKIAVALTATNIIASANRVDCKPVTQGLALNVPDPKTGFTVLGNIAGGPIKVNGDPLDVPWQPLNVIGT